MANVKVREKDVENAFSQLVHVTYPDSDQDEFDSQSVSFQSGPWYQEEVRYKNEIWEKGRQTLNYADWDLGNPDVIIDSVQHVLVLELSDGEMQNLVSLQSIDGVSGIFKKNRTTAAKIFYNLYRNQSPSANDGSVFNQLSDLLGRKIHDPFSVAAYFFFLKDKNLYIPVRRDGYTKRFPMLNIYGINMKDCTWDNYQTVIGIMKQIQTYLQQKMPYEKVDLIDAQSFFWMLYKISETKYEKY